MMGDLGTIASKLDKSAFTFENKSVAEAKDIVFSFIDDVIDKDTHGNNVSEASIASVKSALRNSLDIERMVERIKNEVFTGQQVAITIPSLIVDSQGMKFGMKDPAMKLVLMAEFDGKKYSTTIDASIGKKDNAYSVDFADPNLRWTEVATQPKQAELLRR